MKEIPLSKGKAFALVDDEDYDELIKYKWHQKVTKTNNYAKTSIKRADGKRVGYYMHRHLKNNPKGLQVDHVDHNGLNNQKNNLRVATQRQNNCNNKRKTANKEYRGVFYNEERAGYLACIKVMGRQYSKSYFLTAKEAAKYYDAMAVKYQGEFAVLNFPGEPLVDIEETRNTKGETSHFSKLTTDTVINIRKLFKEGVDIVTLSAQFNTGKENVKSIVKYKSWKHVGEKTNGNA